MKITLFPALLIFAVTPIISQTGSQFITHFEKSNFTETPRYDSVIQFCEKLASYSPLIHYTSFGTSAQQRELPLLILDKDGYTTPGEIKKTGRIILLIEAGIHPGEPDGIDPGLMLFRDIAIYEKQVELLEHVSILFIPIFNVDGHARFGPNNRINQNGPKEMGWRTNANNLNLNRDFVKAEAPAMHAWLKLFHYWMPDFFIDCHTTDGADYQYVLTYEADGNYHPLVNDWMEEMARKMLHESPGLESEFEQWKMDNPEVQKIQWAQLNWFYQRTPYWDHRKNIYPISKLYDREFVHTLSMDEAPTR